MPKQNRSLPDDTSYNKDYAPGPPGDAKNSAPELSSPTGKFSAPDADTSTDSGAHWQKFGMSPAYTYGTAEMAEMCGKKSVTIRLEARTKHIGLLTPRGYVFSDEDKDRMIASFTNKPKARKADISGNNISMAAAILLRQSEQAKILKHLDVGYNSLARLLGAVQGDVLGRIEDIRTDIKELQKGLRDLASWRQKLEHDKTGGN